MIRDMRDVSNYVKSLQIKCIKLQVFMVLY